MGPMRLAEIINLERDGIQTRSWIQSEIHLECNYINDILLTRNLGTVVCCNNGLCIGDFKVTLGDEPISVGVKDNQIAVGLAHGSIALLEGDQIKSCFSAHDLSVLDVTFLGNLIISAGMDGLVRLWDLRSNSAVQEHSFDTEMLCVAVRGESYIIAGDGIPIVEHTFHGYEHQIAEDLAARRIEWNRSKDRLLVTPLTGAPITIPGGLLTEQFRSGTNLKKFCFTEDDDGVVACDDEGVVHLFNGVSTILAKYRGLRFASALDQRIVIGGHLGHLVHFENKPYVGCHQGPLLG